MIDASGGKVILHQLSPFVLFGLRGSGKAVARQVDKVKLPVYLKEVYEPRLSRAGRGFGELFVVAEGID